MTLRDPGPRRTTRKKSFTKVAHAFCCLSFLTPICLFDCDHHQTAIPVLMVFLMISAFNCFLWKIKDRPNRNHHQSCHCRSPRGAIWHFQKFSEIILLGAPPSTAAVSVWWNRSVNRWFGALQFHSGKLFASSSVIHSDDLSATSRIRTGQRMSRFLNYTHCIQEFGHQISVGDCTPSPQLVVGVFIMYQLDHVSLRIDLSNMCNVRFVGLLETGTGHFRSTSSQPTSNRAAVTWHNVSTVQIWSLLFKGDALWIIQFLK